MDAEHHRRRHPPLPDCPSADRGLMNLPQLATTIYSNVGRAEPLKAALRELAMDTQAGHRTTLALRRFAQPCTSPTS